MVHSASLRTHRDAGKPVVASAYTASGGVVFVKEHKPVTLEKATAIHAVHLHNVAHWLGRADLSLNARTGMAKIEQELADEMEAAISQAKGQAMSRPVEEIAA